MNNNIIKIGIPSKGRLRSGVLNIFKNKKLKILSERGERDLFGFIRGKKNIVIPKESSIKIEGGNLTISGPKGTKTLTINDKIFSSKLILNAFCFVLGTDSRGEL